MMLAHFRKTLALAKVFLWKGFTMILKEDLVIVSQEEIAPKIFEIILKGAMVSDMKIGQFIHMRVPDSSMLLRRPISISQVDKDNLKVTLVYRVEGKGTDYFSKMSPGDTIDCMGPQGNGFEIDFLQKGQTALLIGGGIGVPPLVELAKQLHDKGVIVQSVLGFANKNAVILLNEMSSYGNVEVTTDDGSFGIKGYVSTVIDKNTALFDAVYACGAPGMLKYVDEKFSNHPHAYLSMESRMACGMGACYACVVHVKDTDESKNLRVCEDGPVFETGKIQL